MDKFDRELQKEINQDLEKRVHFSTRERVGIEQNIQQTKNVRSKFNPVYWTVLASALSLLLLIGVTYFSGMQNPEPAGESGAAMDLEPETAERQNEVTEHNNQSVEETHVSLEGWTREDMLDPKGESYQVEFTEFESIKAYMTFAKKEWLDSPRANGTFELEQDVQMSVAEVTISYVNFFEEEIQELGLTEEFDELQLLGLALISDYLREEEFKIKARKFEEKLLELEGKL